MRPPSPVTQARPPGRDPVRFPRMEGVSGIGAIEGIAMFASALALRVAYAWLAVGPGGKPYSDAITYHLVALNLSRGLGFSASPDGGNPTAFVPPVMPFLVSLLYRAIGPHYFGAVLLQAAIGSLIPLAVVPLGSALFGRGAGRIAGWLAVFHPILISFSGYLLTETAFTLTLVWALAGSVLWAARPTRLRALAAGALWGLANLTRPTALVLPLAIAVWGGIMLRRAVRWSELALHVVLLIAGLAVVVGPWTLRNARAFHAFVPVTTGGGTSLLDSNNPLNWSDPTLRGGGRSVWDVEPYATRFEGMDEVERDAAARTEAIAFLKAHVPDWPEMAKAKLARFWRLRTEGSGTGVWARRGSLIPRVLAIVDPLLVWSAVILPLALWGVVRIARGRRILFESLPVLVILYFTALAAVFWGGLRLRVPIEPFVLILAASAIADIARRAGRMSRRRIDEG